MSEQKKLIDFPGVDLKSVAPTMTEAGVELGECAAEVARNADLTGWILISSDAQGGLSLSLSRRFPGDAARLQEAIGKLEMAKAIIMDVMRVSARGEPTGPKLDSEA